MVRARWIVLFLTVFVAAFDAWQLNLLPIDVTPDITNKQVQINTIAPTLTLVGVEKRVTYPTETAPAGLSGVKNVHSFSRNGFSRVMVIFKESANLYSMRRQVTERLNQTWANLPEGVGLVLGPVSIGPSEVVYYSVEYKYPRDEGTPVPAGGEAGWQKDGSFVTDEGERLPDSVSQSVYPRTVQD